MKVSRDYAEKNRLPPPLSSEGQASIQSPLPQEDDVWGIETLCGHLFKKTWIDDSTNCNDPWSNLARNLEPTIRLTATSNV